MVSPSFYAGQYTKQSIAAMINEIVDMHGDDSADDFELQSKDAVSGDSETMSDEPDVSNDEGVVKSKKAKGKGKSGKKPKVVVDKRNLERAQIPRREQVNTKSLSSTHKRALSASEQR